MLARPLAQCVSWSRIARRVLIMPISVAFLASEPAGAQTCYQFSNAHGDTAATVIATFPIASIPASFVPAGSPDVEFTAAFSSAPGLENARVSYSPTHIATVVEGSTSHTFNTFVVTIAREGTSRRLQFDAANYPPTDPENTFSVFIQQAAESANPFPHGFPATPPTFSVWGDHPLSSMDLGHVKLSSVSFVGPCAAPRSER
jgi:hypothetical protein